MKIELLKSLFLIFLIHIVAGCGVDSTDELKDPEEPQQPLPTPVLSFNSITLPNEGDTFSCLIHGLANDTWSAACEQSWCNVSTTGNILKIKVQPNTESDERTAMIMLLHTDKRVIGKIEVNQCKIYGDETIVNKTFTKQTFFPMFTATWCPFSPDMDRSLVEIQKRWKYPILPMRIHVKESELYHPLSIELSDLYNNSTTPTGYFENYFRVNNMSDGNVSVDYFWNLILSMTRDSNIYKDRYSYLGCKSTMSDEIINAEISIIPVESGEYRLLVFILEDNIIKPQMTKSDGKISNYCHNGILVGALTSMSGHEFELTTTQKIVSISGSVPSEVNLSNLRLLVVLERNVAGMNYTDDCWYADNCLSVPLGKAANTGMIENIYIGDEIEN